MKHFSTILLVALAGVLAFNGSAVAAAPVSAGQWDADTLDKFATIPILDGGRVKPLDTYASFLMLRLNGKRSFTPPSGKGRMTPMEWFLDCLFYPDVTKDYAHFIVDNADVISTIGATRHEKLRDRYSYNELMPAREELLRLAQEAFGVDQKDRTPTQSTILALEMALRQYEETIHFFDFSNHEISTEGSTMARKIFPDAEALFLSDLLANFHEIRLALQALLQVGDSSENTQYIQDETQSFSEFLHPLDVARGTSIGLALIPPSDLDEKEWFTPSAMVDKTFADGELDEAELGILAALERVAATANNKLAFKQALGEYHTRVVDQAEARGEYGKIGLEVTFYRLKIFYYAQVLFILSFLIAAISWLNLRSKTLTWATVVGVAVPFALLVAGITFRSIIRGRPPVSTLYETVLFITAVAVAAALFMEYVNRQRIAISVAAFLGTLGIFIAGRYEILNKEDTMPQLIAVLDTNFWLATHVVIINIGYAAGMLAAGIAHVFILGKLFGIKRSDSRFYRSITRMVYGTMCFGLIFAFIGTVLGGIWANYSWGRFWGWDPKENGAALICLSMLATIHARNGGYIREMGLHLAAIFTGSVVAFSWWGVNLLGVGLHSYGFTSGIWLATSIFWATQAAVMALGFAVLLRDRLRKQPVDDPSEAVGEVPRPAIAK